MENHTSQLNVSLQAANRVVLQNPAVCYKAFND